MKPLYMRKVYGISSLVGNPCYICLLVAHTQYLCPYSVRKPIHVHKTEVQYFPEAYITHRKPPRTARAPMPLYSEMYVLGTGFTRDTLRTRRLCASASARGCVGRMNWRRARPRTRGALSWPPLSLYHPQLYSLIESFALRFIQIIRSNGPCLFLRLS